MKLKPFGKRAKANYHGVLSQKLKAVKPYRLNWLFCCLSIHVQAKSSSYIGVIRLVFMVWLILQNKPIGKYAERFLLVPRVRPHHPILGYLLNKLKGA